MPDDNGMEFYDSVTGDGEYSEETRTRILEARNGMELEVELYGPDRDLVLDELQKLPEELLELFTAEEIDDPEEAQAQANEADMLKGLNGDAVRAFEEICSLGMRHTGELTSMQMDDIVHELDLQVLFPFGVEIIELSLDSAEIGDFRKPE